MNFIYNFKLSYINILRRKKIIFKNMQFIILSFLIFIASISITQCLNNFIDNYILQSRLHRSVIIEYNSANARNEEIIKKNLNNSNKVKGFLEYQPSVAGKIKNSKELFKTSESKELSLGFTYENEMPRIIKGRNFNNNDKNVGIIPKNFYPDGDLEVDFGKENVEFLNGEDFIGKIITLEISTENTAKKELYSFKVIGVYDTVENLDASYNVYIPYNDLKKINENDINMNTSSQDGFKLGIMEVLVYNSNDVEDIIGLFDEQNEIIAFKKASIGTLDILSKIVLIVGIAISIILFIISSINISLSNSTDIRKRYKEIALLKVVGYQDAHISRVILLENTIITSIGLIVSSIICYIILRLGNSLISQHLSIYMKSFNLTLEFKAVFLGSLVMLLLAILSSMKSIKYVTELNVINAIKK